MPMSTVSRTVDQPFPASPPIDDSQDRDFELATLEPLAREVPNIDSAVAEIARLSAELTLPKGYSPRDQRYSRRGQKTSPCHQ